MPLDGPRAEQLHRRLLAAFPQRYALEKLLLFKLSVELDAISTARDLDEVIFYVIKWARTHDRVGDLLVAARAAAPDDAALQAFDVGEATSSTPTSSTPTSPAPAPTSPSTPTTSARTTAPKARGRAVKGKWKLWENGSTLRVAFLGGTPSLQARVAQVARRWSEHANLRFTFGASPDTAELRVSFNGNTGSWSLVGTDALAVPASEPTINFGWLTDASPDEEITRVVLHEFGHVLGLIHEFTSPNAKIPWDWEAMRAFFQGPPNLWSKEAVDASFAAVPAEDYPGYRAFDPDSIMMFSIPAGHTTNGVGFQQGSGLSEGDARFAAELYPPADDAPATDPPGNGTTATPSTATPSTTTPSTTTPSTTAPAATAPARPRPRPRPTAASANELKMLFLASQPLDQQRLELASEYQEILDQLSPAEGKKTLLPIYLPGVAPKNLYRHFLNFSPVLVHFSGHGDASGQLMFTDAEGAPAPASIESIGNLFGILTGKIRCVVLNACYSRAQAQAIAASIECVIGMSRAIKDTDAIDFANAFYWSIGHGQSVATAFRVGCNRLSLVGRHESVETRHAKPVGGPIEGPIAPSDEPEPTLLVREGADPEQIVLV